MEGWFKNISAAAAEAAERASKLAQQTAEQAKNYAGPAMEKAKVLAQQAAEEAQAKIAQLQAAAATAGSSGSQGDERDLFYYGITDRLLEQVGSMTYSTFSDAASPAPGAVPVVAPTAPGESFHLSPWQAKHAMLVLGRAEQLQHLRYALCPKRMDEQHFWTIYFTQVKDLLPPQAFGLPEAPSAAGSAATASTGGRVSDSAGPSAAAAAATASSSSPSLQKASSGGAGGSRARAGPGEEWAGRKDEAQSAAKGDTGGGSAAGTAAAGTGEGGKEEGEEEEGEGEDADADQLEELEDDPELAAYLQEALALDDEQGDDLGSADLGSVADDDLDDYLNQLKDEEEGTTSKMSSPGPVPPPASSP